MAQMIGFDGTWPSVAVVGCGSWGSNWVRVLDRLGALSLVCDHDRGALRQVGGMAPSCRQVRSLARVLDSEVDAVVLATPADSHFRLARRALVAGKDVLVEKPLALDCRAGAELVRLAAERGRMLMVGHLLEYHPAILELRELIASGVLGELRYLHSSRLNRGTVRAGENVLWSLAPHDAAIVLRLVGELPHEVSATGGSFVRSGVADVATTHLSFPSGVRADVFVSWFFPFKQQRLVVIGSKKTASFDDVSRQLMIYDRPLGTRQEPSLSSRDEGELRPFDSAEPLALEAAAFLEAVRDRKSPLADGRSGLAVLELLEAAQQSMAVGGTPIPLGAQAAVATTMRAE